MSEQFRLAGLMVRMATRPPVQRCTFWLALVLIAFCLAAALLLGQGIADETARAAGRLGADLMIVPQGTNTGSGAKLLGGVPVDAVLPEGIEGRIAAMAGVSRVAPQYIFLSTADPCCELRDVLLVGFDPSRDFTVLPWLRPGEGFSHNREQLLAGRRVMKAAGAAMRFFNHTFTIAARLETSGTTSFDTALFIPLDGLAAMERASRTGGKPFSLPWGQPSLLLVRLAPSTEPLQTARLLEQQFPGIQALTISGPVRESRILLERLGSGQRPLAIAAWSIALLAGGICLYLSCLTRRSALGLLRSCGCGRGVLALMFGLETCVITLAGSVVGGLAAMGVLRLIGPYLAMVTGAAPAPGWVALAAGAISWSLPAFAAVLGVAAVIIVFFMLRSEPADLLRGS